MQQCPLLLTSAHNHLAPSIVTEARSRGKKAAEFDPLSEV
ncbi:hypothetical protein N185_16075 [Sinorhizobium sp. GW3]|nr:hypothetical protein N185_16075 [Sinorhizobium sp. GW3]